MIYWSCSAIVPSRLSFALLPQVVSLHFLFFMCVVCSTKAGHVDTPGIPGRQGDSGGPRNDRVELDKLVGRQLGGRSRINRSLCFCVNLVFYSHLHPNETKWLKLMFFLKIHQRIF